MATLADASAGTDAPLIQQLLDAFDALSGLHPGFRPAHAKGLMCRGQFTPAPEAASLTRAPHVNRPSTDVVVRYSDSSGLPTMPDNDPRSQPKGMAVRFYLGEHVHTDIVAHATNSFPVRTGEEFLQFLRAAAASGPDAAKPTPIESFLASHPQARWFVETPKPVPSSFARENYFAVTAFRFTNQQGASRFGRFQIRPEQGTDYLGAGEAAAKSANFLFDELTQRLSHGPVKLGVFVQLATEEDDVTNSSIAWPDSRERVAFGTLTLTGRVDDQLPEMRKVIFDPIPRVDGIDTAGDPLSEVRAALYLLSGRRRRAAV